MPLIKRGSVTLEVQKGQFRLGQITPDKLRRGACCRFLVFKQVGCCRCFVGGSDSRSAVQRLFNQAAAGLVTDFTRR